MKKLTVASIVGGALALWISSLIPLVAQAEENPSDQGLERADSASGSRPAAGSVEDSLVACMARIPSEASIGQRMIAEQTCRRDESERNPFEAVSGARMIRR